jgi:hypothetical protein
MAKTDEAAPTADAVRMFGQVLRGEAVQTEEAISSAEAGLNAEAHSSEVPKFLFPSPNGCSWHILQISSG